VSFYNGTVLLGTAAPGGTLMTSFSKAGSSLLLPNTGVTLISLAVLLLRSL